jgi:hypothetical protein
MTPETIQQVWILSLVIFTVVLIVVAVLLTLILRTAKQIRAGVSAIWNAGQRVANNTIHLALLDRTNHIAAQILQSAVGVVAATATMSHHAAACQGCPECVIGKRGWFR